MSMRGWYEYHVIDPAANRRTLAMQFYKWGDAIPEHALDEWRMLSGQIDKAAGLLPVVWLDDLLRQALGEQYARLPAHFSVAAFLFLIQRAEEAQRSFNNWEFRDLPKEERPDPDGGDLFVKLEDRSDKTARWAESDREEASRLMDLIAEGKVDRYSLKEAEATFQCAEDSFWGPHCHERPPLPPALAAER